MGTEKGPIGRSKKKEGTVRGAQKPSWIADKENQKKWNGSSWGFSEGTTQIQMLPSQLFWEISGCQNAAQRECEVMWISGSLFV